MREVNSMLMTVPIQMPPGDGPDGTQVTFEPG